MTDVASRLALALDLAREAGALARDMRIQAGAGFVASKGHQDFVTAADKAVEALLRRRILAAFPEDGFLGEEGGQQGAGPLTWVVDPIDGTTNFLMGLPEWGVSIACIDDNEVLLGVIAVPDLNRTAWCSRGGGAFLEGQRLDLGARAQGGSRLAILGHSDRLVLSDHLQTIEGLLHAGYEYRRQGAACFGLLAVAAGWADFYFEGHLNPWDAMAGLLMVREAGGQVDTGPMAGFLADGSPVLASSTPLAADLRRLLRPPLQGG